MIEFFVVFMILTLFVCLISWCFPKVRPIEIMAKTMFSVLLAVLILLLVLSYLFQSDSLPR